MKFTRESWVIYYTDESTFSNQDGPPEMAPKIGMICICHFNLDNRREIVASKDFGWYDETPIYKDEKLGTFFGGDWAGLFQYLARPGKKVVYFGATIHDFVFRRIMERVTKEFPEALPFTEKLPELR